MVWLIILFALAAVMLVVWLFLNGADMRKRDPAYKAILDDEQEKIVTALKNSGNRREKKNSKADK